MSSNSRGFPFLEVAATVTAMSKFAAADTLEMPVAERLQLVEDIWDTIAENPLLYRVPDQRHANLRVRDAR